MTETIAVAMSGGVDSSVVAALLLKEGHRVFGITMQLYPASCSNGSKGPSTAATDAAAVARQLGIEHYIIDVNAQFEQYVFDNFKSEYLAGRTPNPCVVCNRFVKFGFLLEEARRRGATHLATGHYVRVSRDPATGCFCLARGLDSAKDQSYMLYRLTQNQLSAFMAPLGTMTKPQVRVLARQFGLPVAEKKESQDICFSDYRGYGHFMNDEVPQKARPGIMRTTDGKMLGEHKGIAQYTIGQRRKIGVAAARPLYVVAIDAQKNEIVVGFKEDVLGSELIADQVHFQVPQKTAAFRVKAKIRYQHPLADAGVRINDNGTMTVHFDEPQESITPGQSVVLYDGDTVLGGGVIRERVW